MWRVLTVQAGSTAKVPGRYIQIRQSTETWQPFKISGGYPRTGNGVPLGTGHCELRKPQIPCLFRRSVRSHKFTEAN